MGEFLTEILLGLFVIGSLLLHWQQRDETIKVKASLLELLAEVDHNSSRITGFSKFMRIVEKAQKRNGGAA